MTCNALEAACRDFIDKEGFQFASTSHFNQDVVENWFSCIHGKGCKDDLRTTLESAGKNIAVNWQLEHPENGSNCQLDCDSFIGSLRQTELCKCSKMWNYPVKKWLMKAVKFHSVNVLYMIV